MCLLTLVLLILRQSCLFKSIKNKSNNIVNTTSWISCKTTLAIQTLVAILLTIVFVVIILQVTEKDGVPKVYTLVYSVTADRTDL